ncbi:TetR/AcrR family transcriptional regulator [Microbispora bryophytorum]|uniref:TetR/AcrR family transcriptional regulator n=1 Tax=Microbispora bryophytorum TaxID=1460882 RepID=UPI0037115C61
MTGTDDGGLSDRVLQVATRLFTGLGYDGTDMRQIADAAGTDVAYVRRRFGDKREIYLEVMDRMNSAHNAVLEKGVKDIVGASPEQKIVALHRLLDRYIDFCRRQPEYPALYTHRWLSDATDIPELEPMYAAPAAQFVIDAITPLVTAPDVDVDYTINSVIWCVHSFVQSGVYDRSGRRYDHDHPGALWRFRSYLHQMVHRTLRLPGEPPPMRRPSGR